MFGGSEARKKLYDLLGGSQPSGYVSVFRFLIGLLVGFPFNAPTVIILAGISFGSPVYLAVGKS